MAGDMQVGAVILAAGLAQRMGGQDKMTADLGGLPVIRHVALAARDAGLAPRVVVTGAAQERLDRALAGLDVTIAINPEPRRGLASSLTTGLAALPAEVGAAAICLGDMPLVRPATLRALARALADDPRAKAAVPVHDGRWGNPVLWRRARFAELMALTGDRGARGLLESLPDDGRILLPVADPGVLRDIDTPADLEGMRRDPT